MSEQINLIGGAEGALKTFGPFIIGGASNVSVEIKITSPPDSWSNILVYDADQVLTEEVRNPGSSNPLTEFWTDFSSGDILSA